MITIFKSTSPSQKTKNETNNPIRAQKELSNFKERKSIQTYPGRSPFYVSCLPNPDTPKIGRRARFIRERRTSIIKENAIRRFTTSLSFSLSLNRHNLHIVFLYTQRNDVDRFDKGLKIQDFFNGDC